MSTTFANVQSSLLQQRDQRRMGPHLEDTTLQLQATQQVQVQPIKDVNNTHSCDIHPKEILLAMQCTTYKCQDIHNHGNNGNPSHDTLFNLVFKQDTSNTKNGKGQEHEHGG